MGLAKYLQFSPAGCSYKQMIHYAMGIQNPGIDLRLIARTCKRDFSIYRSCVRGLRTIFAGQINRSYFAGHFRPYDNGILSNLRTYRRIVPPEYPVHKITAPVILYVGLNDWLAHPKVGRDIAQFSLVKGGKNFFLLYDYALDLVSYFVTMYCEMAGRGDIGEKIAKCRGEVHSDGKEDQSLRLCVRSAYISARLQTYI